MRNRLSLALFLSVICVCSSASGKMWYVDGAVVSSGKGASWETALKTIQEGIDKAVEGDTVTVAQALYTENIHFSGKNIILTGTDPLDPSVVADTIIDGNNLGSVVTFSGTETKACILSGFTIRNGNAEYGGGICGGTWDVHTHGTIQNNTIMDNRGGYYGGGLGFCGGTTQNNTITANSAGWGGGALGWCNGTIQNNMITDNSGDCGGGLDGCGGTIQNNTIAGNSAEWGGGLGWCGGTIQNNTIAGNSAQEAGGLDWCGGTIQNNTIAGNSAQEAGGLGWCNGTIQNNTITGNSADDGGALAYCGGTIQNNTITGNSAQEGGGALGWCNGTIQNNTIRGNWASYGGGLNSCDGTIQNNTITGNSAQEYGGGLFECNGAIRNCIVWANRAPSGPQLYESCIPSFSCVQGWSGGGQGNIPSDPRFVNPKARDYHLQQDSPCIDAGANYYWFAWPQRNGDGNCRLVGLAVDMGCYEYGSSTDADGDLLSDSDESAAGTDPLRDDSDGDGLRDGLELLRGTNPLQLTPPGVLNVPSDFDTVQRCLSVSIAGDEIIVAPGTYCENLQFCGPDIILRTSDPGDPNVVGSTIIDGGGAGPVVWFMGGESETCVLAGFTLRNGDRDYGGGISGEGTLATIQNNTITDNSAVTGGGLISCEGTIQNNTITGNSALGGGGLAYCGGTIQNNTITGNSANSGGGLYNCNGTIHKNTITGNSAQAYGGALYSCGGTIQNNTITGNSAQYEGGGLDGCNGTIQNNTITGNSAQEGGGLCVCHGTIQNNTITDNSAGYGGGLYYCNGTIQNNTITGNSAGYEGGGLYLCGGTIRNCILWGNTAPTGPQSHESNIPTYCCIEGWSGGGQGNIASEPRFVNPEAHDYHLQEGSLCIDAGANYYWFAWPQRDADGNCRLVGPAVDMGCYEYGSSVDMDGDLLSDADEWAAGTDPLRDDSDGDGLRDGLELLRGSNALQLTPPGILNVPSQIATIQQSLCVSMAGDEIIVAPGTYPENLQFCGADIILRSSDPHDSNVVSSTILDGGGAGPVVSFMGSESEECVLAGFTICNGSGQGGGGIKGSGTLATIQNNTITGNSGADGGGLRSCQGTVQNNTITGNSAQYGGGLYGCEGTIQNNTISGNSAADWGGGLHWCNGTIQNNTITGNSAEYGGGLEHCNGTIQNNTITGNSAYGGGGLAGCDGPIQNNRITGNSAGDEGGGLYGCHGTIQNNTITGNSAESYGGGLAFCFGTIQNNTIAANSAEWYGGGLNRCTGTVGNCIIWANTAPTGPQVYDSTMPTHSCIQHWTGGGEGNIAEDPRFLDANHGDFRLLPDSPCIDAGFNYPGLPEFDIAGMHRIMFGGKSLAVDMGAYEFHIWPPTEDADAAEVTLKWSSLTGKTYSVYHSGDMLNWDVLADNIASAGDTVTTWIDSMGPVLPPGVRIRYYKIMENP